MTSAVNAEFLALCGVRHLKGSAFTPRHQGPGEREHLTIMTSHLLLMNAVCKAFPQEWASLVPALEYLLETAPRPPYGLSAFDLTMGFALASDTDRALAPFQVPRLLPETEVAARLFDNFRELHGLVARMTGHEALKKQAEINRKRCFRSFEKGETVFRRMPSAARPAKHLLAEPSSGPYLVDSQQSLSSVVLRDPVTNTLVDGGVNIPLDQILAGPYRNLVKFGDRSGDVRGVGEMLRREHAPPAGVHAAPRSS